MREIKFRAWDKTDKEMFQVSLINFELGNVSSNGFYSRKFKRIKKPNCILMQYTGLKDKNGKEIYEGDVVINNAITRPAKVHYQQSECRFGKLYKDGLTISLNELSEGFKSIEIIGNIHENHELLEKVNE